MMKLQWPRFNDERTVIIELPQKSIRPEKMSIEVSGKLFTVKDEFHVTLIGTQLGLILLDKIKQDAAVEILLKKTFESIDWTYGQSGPVHMLSRKKGRNVQKSIIILIDMPGVTEFYQRVNILGLIDSDTPAQPAHRTLYTYNCPPGIGVPSDVALKELTTKTLTLDEFKKLR